MFSVIFFVVGIVLGYYGAQMFIPRDGDDE